MKTMASRFAASALLLPALFLAGCSGGSTSDQIGGGSFIVLKTEPSDNGRIFLNQSIRIFFSNPVDLTTANFNSVAFFVRNANNDPVSEQVFGKFRHGTDANGDTDATILEFVPRLPSNDTFTNGGFKPARIYNVSLVNSANPSAPTLRDSDGRSLSPNSPVQGMTFRTASGSTPKELFIDRRVGGPRTTKITVTPTLGSGRVTLNRMGELPVEVTLRFNQPLNPASTNVPLRQDLNPVNFKRRVKGRIFLEYDDPVLGKRRWIPTNVELPENDATGATVTMRPDGVLPNAADIRVIVEAELQDISGESNVNDASYQRIVATFKTEDAYSAQFDAVVLDFESNALMDPEAAFRDPVAELTNGVLRASFNFEGLQTPFDFEPQTRETILSTDVTTVVPKNGPPLTVTGGVFRFRNITIPEGKVVRGVGSNPMVWLATGQVDVKGHLHVDGGDGGQVDTLNGANFPTAGGTGVCTGGNGGKGSPDTADTSQKGENGFGPLQRPNQGGEGADVACQGAGSQYGAGGGGGSHATKGDAEFRSRWNHNISTGNGGDGRRGSSASNYPGGKAGPLTFTDTRDDNDFWGRNVDDKGNVINGELTSPLGGAGGGGGGDRTTAGNGPNPPCRRGTTFANDEKGGGGGGGAGALVIKALGKITVWPKGAVTAEGGRGGGGEDAGSCRQGGGGGGGAGGQVVLMSATGIDIYQHQGRWQGNDSNFAISADGSFGRNSGFGRPARFIKYQATIGSVNAGGFGGMGIVQLMAPPGEDKDNGGNGTGTVQDDNIRILDGAGKEVANKTPWLFQGDIRPDPILLPPPFSRFSQGRTRWIATGATERRVVGSTSGVRATTSVPTHEKDAKTYGPDWYFAGIRTAPTDRSAGYVKTNTTTGRQEIKIIELKPNVTRVPISGKVARRSHGSWSQDARHRSRQLAASGRRFAHEPARASAQLVGLRAWRLADHRSLDDRALHRRPRRSASERSGAPRSHREVLRSRHRRQRGPRRDLRGLGR